MKKKREKKRELTEKESMKFRIIYAELLQFFFLIIYVIVKAEPIDVIL